MRYCPRCGGQIRQQVRFCDQCGYSLSGSSKVVKARIDRMSTRQLQTSPPEVSHSNPMIAAILALGPGFFGVMGLGHIYVNSRLKGLVLLAIGAVLSVLTWVSIVGLFLLSPPEVGPEGETLIVAAGIFSLIFFSLWLWQAYDAYSIAKKVQPTSDTILPPPYY